jgi:hypothetical protein
MNRSTNKSALYLPCRDSEESEAANDVPSQPFMNILCGNCEEVDDRNEGEDPVEYGVVTNLAGLVGANLEEGKEKIYLVIDHGKETRIVPPNPQLSDEINLIAKRLFRGIFSDIIGQSCAHKHHNQLLDVFTRYIYNHFNAIIRHRRSFLFNGHPSHHDNDPVAVDIAVWYRFCCS